MASFDAGNATTDSLNTVALGAADAPQQPLVTPPQHG
jgi:hypothetical protein